MSPMPFVYHDGGRAAAGYRGDTGDCVCRAIAIATEQPYAVVYTALIVEAMFERRKSGRSHPRTGVHALTFRRYLERLGWHWTPLMRIGSGCRVHLDPDQLPSGRLIVSLSKHICAVIDGVVYDTHDPSRGSTRCVYGLFAERQYDYYDIVAQETWT